MFGRPLCAALLGALCLSLATAAPVPKQAPKPAPLTAEQLVGYHDYSWGQFPSGYIYFDKNGDYGAVHDAASGTAYGGTWSVKDEAVTIVEYIYDMATGERRGGPTTFVFDFKGSRYPNLVGVSNGSVPVAITRVGK